MRLQAAWIAVALGLAAIGSAQSLTFREALEGKRIPASLKPKELGNDFWALKITISGETSLLDLYGGAFAFQFRGSSDSNDELHRSREALLQASGVYWTRGEKVRVESQEYLVAYRLDIPVAAIASSSNGFDMWAIENPLELALQLIRPESIAKMTPVPTLSPEKLVKAVESFTRTLAEGIGVSAEELGTARATAPANQQSKQTQALSNAKQIATGMMIYMADWDDLFPPKPSTPNVQNVIRPYLKNDALWNTGNPNKSRFLFNPALAGVSAVIVPEPSRMPLIYEDKAWPDGRRVVAFADSSARLVSKEQWATMAPLLKAKLKAAKPPPRPPTPSRR
jgi:hypothetical protein